MQLPSSFFQQRKLEHLVENQTTYTLQNAELHVFETHQKAQRVMLKFHYPVLASMLEGKKIMHLNQTDSFSFLPGESLTLPAHEPMCIDFPEAEMHNPTRCLAMTISEEIIKESVTQMNDCMPKADQHEWLYSEKAFHFINDQALYQLIKRLLFLCSENHPSKDFFVNFCLKELIMRVLQSENKQRYTQDTLGLNNTRMATVIQYIREHLEEELSVEQLSKQAHMSESNFHRTFKHELGESPINFINQERIKKAEAMLKDPSNRVKDVYLACGFNSLSYFNRVFKRAMQVSPKAFQKRNCR